MTAEPISISSPIGVRVVVRHVGPSYVVDVPELDARLVFRDVRADRELSADVAVNVADVHVLRTTSSLSLTGRDRLARVAHDLSGSASADLWRRAVHAAAEAVMAAEERLGGGTDLRTAPVQTAGPLFVAEPLAPDGASGLVAPGESGKSTIVRAVALSVAADREIIPGIRPVTSGPVLYVAAEDPVAAWHARSLEAIARGAGINRADVPHPVTLLDVRGRKLHRIGRTLAERAADFALVILDSQQALLPSADAAGGGIRDRDSLFFDAVDAIGRPVLIVAHPNLSGARRWADADGRMAGSEVNRDRLRMSWRAEWEDEKAVVGTSFRRYTLTCTKWNHGPRPDRLAFAAAWTFGVDNDPGALTFTSSEPLHSRPKLTPVEAATLEAYDAGARTPSELARALGIEANTAKARIRRLREAGHITSPEVAE